MPSLPAAKPCFLKALTHLYSSKIPSLSHKLYVHHIPMNKESTLFTKSQLKYFQRNKETASRERRRLSPPYVLHTRASGQKPANSMRILLFSCWRGITANRELLVFPGCSHDFVLSHVTTWATDDKTALRKGPRKPGQFGVSTPANSTNQVWEEEVAVVGLSCSLGRLAQSYRDCRGKIRLTV